MVDLSQLLSSLHSFEPIGARYSQLCDFEILSGLNFIFSISRCQIKCEQTALNVFCLNIQLLLKACFLDYFSPVISLYFGSCIAQEISLYIFTHMHIHVHVRVHTHMYYFTYLLGAYLPSTGTTMPWQNVIRVPQQITFTNLVMELNLKGLPISLI